MVIILQLFPYNAKAAIGTSVPDRTIILTTDTDKPTTGYNATDGYYADINWEAVTKPSDSDWDYVYYNIYIQEVSRTGVLGAYSQKLKDVSSTKARLRNLKSGTIYNVYVAAIFKKVEIGNIVSSSEGEKSNIVTIMTDIQVYASPYGSKQLKIEWDDVWLAGSRISYNLYIADDSAFAGTEPIPIAASQIGADGKVNVDQAAGRLNYIHTVKDSGRVYYIKIKPEFGSLPIYCNPESKVVATSSFILVKTTKMYDTSAGTVWKLDWSEVAVAFQDIKISYQIFKVDKNNNNLQQYMLSVDDNSTYLTVPVEDTESYYIIRAMVTNRLGEDIYKDWNIKIQSDKVYLKDSEVAAIPAAPVLVNDIVLPPSTVVESYIDSLKPDSAALLWELPKKGNGDIDYDISYDMWMITDPLKLDNPDNSSLVAQDIKLSDVLVINGTSILGAKHQLTSLVPNSTYYFRIVAKKTFVEYVDGNVENVTLTSQPSTKLVITPPKDNGDIPVAIAAPPLKVKTDDNGNKIVTDTTAIISLKNKWYEKYNNTYEIPRWEYVEPVATLQSDGTVLFTPNDQTVANDVYGDTLRKVEYDGGVTIDVGAIKVTDLPEGFKYDDLNDIEKYPLTQVKAVSVTPNDTTENAGNNPDGLKHNVNIQLSGLDPNTNYIIWVRALRSITGVISNASDPIFITTATDGSIIPEKPPVPSFNYGYAGDTYVELGWAYNTDFVYNIKYSTGEDVEKAEGKITIKGSDMVNQKILKISELIQATNYYFWIQAEYSYNGTVIASDFGDAFHLMTTEFTPPHSPYGFGIKGGDSSITKSSITYEWMTVAGLEYFLEIADNIDYKNSTLYEVGTASELIVEGLKSNTRYYARLYAYDSTTELKSEPTQSIIAKTLKSKEDYDTDEDTDTVISGDFIIKDPYAAGQTWDVSIIGVNADRFIESIKNGKQLEYVLDLKTPPSEVITINVTMSAKIFTELSRLGRTFTFATQDYSVSFGPGTLDSYTSKADVYANYVVALSSGISDSNQKPDKIAVKTKIGRMEVKIQDGTGYSKVESFGEAALVSYNIKDLTWYNESDSYGYVLMDKDWNKKQTDLKQDTMRDKNYLLFSAEAPCDFLVGQHAMAPYTDVLGNWANDAIKTLTEKRELKSVQGSLFKPDAYATLSDTVKMIFDVTGYEYSSNYILEAYRAGLIDRNDALAPNSYCTTEKALYMIMTVYEKKSGESLTLKGSASLMLQDMDNVSYQYMNKVYFAVENGIYSGRDKTRLHPTESVTRAELVVILVRYLEFMGEIQ